MCSVTLEYENKIWKSCYKPFSHAKSSIIEASKINIESVFLPIWVTETTRLLAASNRKTDPIIGKVSNKEL